MKTCFDAIAAAESARRERAAKAKEIYATVTLPNLTKLQEILDAIQKEIDRQGVAEAPLPAMVSDLRRTVLSLTLAALAASIVLAVAIGKSLARPLHRCAESLRALARQEFDKRCDLQRGDELGQVADAINESIAATQSARRPPGDPPQRATRLRGAARRNRAACRGRTREGRRSRGEDPAAPGDSALEKQKAEEQAAGAAEWERWQAEAAPPQGGPAAGRRGSRRQGRPDADDRGRRRRADRRAGRRVDPDAGRPVRADRPGGEEPRRGLPTARV